MAPSVMKSVLTAVLAHDETVNRATSSYLDDIFVNEDVGLCSTRREPSVAIRT